MLHVTEYGSNRKLTILSDKILHLEKLSYRDGTTVTVITFINDKTVHVLESLNFIEGKLRNN